MKLTLERLSADLAEQLRPVYLLSGDEPLRVGEALDALRAAARSRGYEERQVFFIERQGGAAWEEVQQAAQALSLFASRRVVEIRMPSGKPGVSGATALTRLAGAAGGELLVVIVTGQLEREAQNAPWVQAVQERGAWIPIWPLERARLPQWLRARFTAVGLSASDAAVALLAERSEGNLLAARQEVDKLALLLARGARVELADVVASSSDSARFDVFQLGEAVRAGEAARALRVLASLKSEGTELVLVLWALLRELRGRDALPPRGAPRRLLQRAARVDRMAKGMLSGEPWDEVALLAAELCGALKLSLLPTRSAASSSASAPRL